MTPSKRHMRPSGQPDRRIRILLADDHALIREGVRLVLGPVSDRIVLAGEAERGQELLELAERVEWDVLVLDLQLPDEDGFDILGRLRSRHPDRGILILSTYPVATYGLRAIQAGADGYLRKNAPADELVRAIEEVARGGKYIPQELSAQLATAIHDRTALPLHEHLSNREFQVLRLLASGSSAKEIAIRLHLSEKTVNTYRCRLRTKMGFENLAQLIEYAVRHGLTIDPPPHPSPGSETG